MTRNISFSKLATRLWCCRRAADLIPGRGNLKHLVAILLALTSFIYAQRTPTPTPRSTPGTQTAICNPIPPPVTGTSQICLNWSANGAASTVTSSGGVQVSGPIIAVLGSCIGGMVGNTGCNAQAAQDSITAFVASAGYTNLCTPASPGANVPNCTAANVNTAIQAFSSNGTANPYAWGWIAFQTVTIPTQYVDVETSGNLMNYITYSIWPGLSISGNSNLITVPTSGPPPNPTSGIPANPASLVAAIVASATTQQTRK